MKRRLILICIAILLLAGVQPVAGVFADADHPITMFIQIEPDPELETGGTVPDMLFTIRNSGKEDYTLEHAVLSGGYEDRTLNLDAEITVLAGGTKEFHLTDVVIADEQLDTDVVYRLSWKETEYIDDEESGAQLAVVHDRETEARIRIERFIPPELTVSVKASAERVRAGENFTVTYTIINNTKYDMSGLRLYDPEQSMQSIGLTSTELIAGDSMRVEVTYPMGKKDMTFAPVIEYTVRQREQMTKTETPLTVESVVVELVIETEQYPPTNEGTTFAVTVRNNGNRAVTHIQLFDEINTAIEGPFDLAPEQSKVLFYTVPSAISSDKIRKIQFHVTAVDCLETVFSVTDPNTYEAVPYIDSEAVNLTLYVVLQRAYYDDNGKLCASIQCEIRNFSRVTLRNAKLTEQMIFGQLASYPELQNGETYFITNLQLDGVSALTFRVEAFDPAGKSYVTEAVSLDLSGLRALADQTDDPVYVTTNNPYFRNLAEKYGGILRIIAIALLLVAGVCAIICIVLYAVERRIKAKLPPEFEENMENAMQKAKRRMEPQIFHDAATEQFGYSVPIKLRSYGELTEEEAEARKREYRDKLDENLRTYSASPAAVSKRRTTDDPQSTDPAFSGTRIMPVTRARTDTLSRNDIQIISVNPIEPEQTPQKRAPKKPRVDEATQQIIIPTKDRRQSEQTASEPQKQPKKPVRDALLSDRKDSSVQRTVQTTEPQVNPFADIPIATEAPMPNPMRQAPLTDTKIIPVAAQPFETAQQTAAYTEPTAPRVLQAIEQPARRPVRPMLVKRMNG